MKPPSEIPFIPADQVLRSIAFRFMVPVAEIKGKSRKRHFMRPRAAAVWILRQTGGNSGSRSFPNIGKILGGRDHSTIIHSESQCVAWMRQDAIYRTAIEGVLADLIAGVRAPTVEPEYMQIPDFFAKPEDVKPECKPKNDFSGDDSYDARRKYARNHNQQFLAAIARHHPERLIAA